MILLKYFLLKILIQDFLKIHNSLGFSLGDELGFPESLGNLEANKRRSLNVRPIGSAKFGATKVIIVSFT